MCKGCIYVCSGMYYKCKDCDIHKRVVAGLKIQQDYEKARDEKASDEKAGDKK